MTASKKTAAKAAPKKKKKPVEVPVEVLLAPPVPDPATVLTPAVETLVFAQEGSCVRVTWGSKTAVLGKEDILALQRHLNKASALL